MFQRILYYENLLEEDVLRYDLLSHNEKAGEVIDSCFTFLFIHIIIIAYEKF